MAQFIYTGDHESTNVFGVDFFAGRPSEVSNEAHAAKLRANSHFIEFVDGVEVQGADVKRGPGRPRRVGQE